MPMTAYQPAHYRKISPGCVTEGNFVLYKEKTVPECEALCDARSDCLAFEYGVDHGGLSTRYDPNDCQLNYLADNLGCDGKSANLDLYIKFPPLADMPGQPTYTEHVGYKCDDQSAN